MTIVVWTGKMLVTDRRVSKVVRSKESGAKKHVSRTDGRDKIDVDFRRAVFRGEPILAVAAAGGAKLSKEVKERLRAGRDVVREYALAFKREESHSWRRSTFLIITPTTAYKYTLTRSKGPQLVEVGNDLTVIGSGARDAQTLMKLLDLDPRLAVSAVSLINESCGGGYSYVRRSGDTLGEIVTNSAGRRVYPGLERAIRKRRAETA